jgi:methionyl-tRNA formyltransferase
VLTPQDESLATYAPKLEKLEGRISWNRQPAEIAAHVRAMRPWPRSYTYWIRPAAAQVQLFIEQVLPVTTAAVPLQAGTVRASSNEGIEVACGRNGTESVLITRLQRAGKQILPARDFLRGTPLVAGEVLESLSVSS